MPEPLNLEAVTAVTVDCVNVPLALAALERSGRGCRFARRVLFTSEPVASPPAGIEVVNIAPIRSKREYSHFLVKQLPAHVHTPHVLVMQWDGFVTRPEAWDPRFLEYDYIGAPWPADLSPVAVGNGGFSLRSRKLLDALLDPSFPEAQIVHEDQAICVHFRERLERDFGIRFAPADLAARFSHETTHTGGATFGFHGPQNLWQYWNEAEIEQFLRTVSRRALAAPETTWLARHLYNADRLREAARVAAAALVESPDNGELLEILGNVRDRSRRHDYAARSEQRFFLGLLKRHLPAWFRERTVLEICRPGVPPATGEWFERCRIVATSTAPPKGPAEGPEAFSASSGTFDTIVSCEALEHLPQWRDAFENAIRMLKPDGLMAVSCAGLGRRQHETARYSAPGATTDTWYRNLAPEDFAGIDLDAHFGAWAWFEDRTVHDLTFVGLGRDAPAESLALLRRLAADQAFLMKRRNVFGIY